MKSLFLLVGLACAGCAAETSFQSETFKLGSQTQQVLRLPGLVDRALSTHPKLREFESYIREARYGIDEVNAARNPRIDFETSVGAFSAKGDLGVEARGIMEQDKSSYLYSVSAVLRQTISDFGRTKWRGLAAALHEKTARENLRLQQNILAALVSVAFIDAFGQQLRLENAQITLANARRIEAIAKARVDAGDAPAFELNRVQMSVVRAEGDVNLVLRDYRNALSKLSSLVMVRYSSEEQLVFSREGLEVAQVPDRAQGIQIALASRPELGALDFGVSAGRASVEATRAERNPNLSVEAVLNFSGVRTDSGYTNWGIFLTLNIPLYDGGITRALEGQAQAKVDALVAQRQSVELEITNEVETVHNNLLSERKSMELARELHEKARRNLTLVEAAYREGLSNLQQVIDALQEANSAAAEAVNSENAYLQQLATWRRVLANYVTTTVRK